MTAIITGDIINSRLDTTGKWREKLRKTLNQFGQEPSTWEIFRGDSFQLELESNEALKASIQIKASIKQIKNLDVRIAIGLGEKDFTSAKITESTGSAFINSGECFDQLKKDSLKIKSQNNEFDNQMNLYIALALLTMDNWSPTTSEIVETAITNQKLLKNDI